MVLGAGRDPGWVPSLPAEPGSSPSGPAGSRFAAVPGAPGVWLEVPAARGGAVEALLPAVTMLLHSARDRSRIAGELAVRREEVELLYSVSEILGRTVSLGDAARMIVSEVSEVVGARRASLMVFDERGAVLRTIAATGFDAAVTVPVSRDDPESVAARAFREQRVAQRGPEWAAAGGDARGRGYQGGAYLSVPVCHAVPGLPTRCVGVINFTDREGEDRFTPAERRLVTVVANLIAVAIENARLVSRERQQQRVRRELELAHDLQLRLLPAPAVLHGDAEVAARCVPAEWVGGDFYTFSRLGRGRVGVMLGDVSSHGFSAALVSALVLSAAGIHAGAAVTPDEALAALLESLTPELATTEMYLTVFYGVLDRAGGRLTWANAGHPHAFRLGPDGAERLGATAPPLGLAGTGTIGRRQLPWNAADDLLCLWTDGLVEARSATGEPFGEARLLALLQGVRREPPARILERVMAAVQEFAAGRGDDRSLLVLRL